MSAWGRVLSIAVGEAVIQAEYGVNVGNLRDTLPFI